MTGSIEPGKMAEGRVFEERVSGEQAAEGGVVEGRSVEGRSVWSPSSEEAQPGQWICVPVSCSCLGCADSPCHGAGIEVAAGVVGSGPVVIDRLVVVVVVEVDDHVPCSRYPPLPRTTALAISSARR